MWKWIAAIAIVALPAVASAAEEYTAPLQPLLDKGFRIVAAEGAYLYLQKDNQVFECADMGEIHMTGHNGVFKCKPIH